MVKTQTKIEFYDLWVEYRKARDLNIRNRLINQYMSIVRYHAERIHIRLPKEVELDDCISAGIFGLIDAINSFNPDRGVKFSTFSAQRIRGAIVDELRSTDWVPRLVRDRASKVDGATALLTTQLGRLPYDVEIAKELNVSHKEYDLIKSDCTPTTMNSLARKWFETDSDKNVCQIDMMADRSAEQPLDIIADRDTIKSYIKGLARAEQLIIILYYCECMTMVEIGKTLDLSESRVSQMHASILARLKAKMATEDSCKSI